MQDEIRSAEGQPGVELLQKALATFMDDIRVSLGNGTLQCGDDASAAAAGIERQQKLRAELETQKTILTARLERFQKVRAQCQYCHDNMFLCLLLPPLWHQCDIMSEKMVFSN